MRAGVARVADDRLSERGGGSSNRLSVRARVRYRLTPWWAKVIAIFVLSRVVTTAILLQFASFQPKNPWTAAHPNYFDFSAIWDGHWYYIIAAVGYPSELPITLEGNVGESAWAFMPGYPALVRGIMIITGLGFPVVSVTVSVAFALGTALVFYRLMARVLPASTALFAVVLFCVAPLSPILQVSYAESMHTFLLALALLLLLQRRYWVMFPVIAVMSLTRPSGLAFALALGLHVVYRWWMSRPARAVREEFSPRDRVAAVSVTLFSGFMGIAWLLIAWAFTGSPSAYTDTELAWRAPYVGYGELRPFTPWIQATEFWAPWFGMTQPILIALLAILVVAVFVALFTPAARKLGPDLRFWIASYVLYLLAVFYPQSSTFRLLVPLFPALGIIAQPRSSVYRIAIVAVCIAGQVLWTYVAWWVNGRDWTPP